MEKVIRIEGMKCGHCSSKVQAAFEDLDAIANAAVSHEAGTAVLTLAEPISDEEIIAVVEGAGFQVVEIV